MSTKISVCMAAYNGQKYIRQQILSILSQLTQSDELIIVNDCSNDRTIQVINEIKDIRINVINNDVNIGVIRSFEKSISCASGDIIFLSDQDDIWMANKVIEIIAAFDRDKKVTIVVSDAMLIDGDGEKINESFFATTGKFHSGILKTILKNRYLGCTLAFKKEMIENILPFPNGIPMHDIWIGIVNDIYGKSYYINKPLVKYRRHELNVTSLSSNNMLKAIKYRISLVKAISCLLNK